MVLHIARHALDQDVVILRLADTPGRKLMDWQIAAAIGELLGAIGVAVDSSGNVYVTGENSDNVFKIATPGTCSTTGTPCTITKIIDSTGDGGGNTLDRPQFVAVDSGANVYVSGASSKNVFKIGAPHPVPALAMGGLAVLTAALIGTALWWIPRRLHGTHA